MLYGLLAVGVGGLAIVFSKFVMPKMQDKMEQQAAEQKAKRDAKKAAKEEAEK
jgi:hypothetical protein